MSNSMKNRLNRKGVTLAEVLVTVAIILILAGVTFVSVAQYQKNLRLMEMDGTAKEIFIAAQNHLSVAKASGDLDRLAEKANATGTTGSPIGTKLDSSAVSAYAGNVSGNYYYVIHNVSSGTESCTPSGSDEILQMMLPFGALDETISVSGNYVIVYELKSASVVAVLYSGAGNASFGNAAVITLDDGDVNAIPTLYSNKSARKNYQKGDVTAIIGCYTGTAGSAAIPTETLEAPTLEVKNENKLHVLVREANNTDNITLVITGEQSGTTARRLLDRNTGDGYTKTSGTFDVTLDDITGGDGAFRFCQLIKGGRFTPDVAGSDFIPGENIIISAIASSTTALATPKESAKYTVSSLFDDVNETTNSNGDTKVYIKNLRHLENLGANVSGFTAALRKDATSGHYNVVNITAVQKNDITMFSFEGLHDAEYKHIYGSGTFANTYIAANVSYPLSYDGGSHEIYDLTIAGYHKDGDEANAGIFGTVTSTLSVKNLVLRNDKIPKTSTSANAGMLLGKTCEDLTVDGVLAYYHEDSYDETKDSSVEVTASQNAGGLIGLVSGGKLDVKNSAAAVYVKGESAAGGFIGSVVGAADGSTIVQSYAGGHTKNGAYSTTDATTKQLVLTGAGRYNVQASGYAGGFIGVTTNQVQMDNVYATTSVYSSSYSDSNKCSGSFAGTGTLSIPAKAEKDGSTKKHYYALGPHNGVDATKEELACAELAQGQAHRQATPYDRKLVLKDKETAHPKMDKTSYPLCTVRNLCEEDASVKDTDLPWFIKEHVGDWVLQKAGEAKFEVDNGNRLTVRIDTGLKEITGDLYYEIKVHGESSNKDKYFLLHVKNDAGEFTLERADSIIEKISGSNMNQQNICKIVPVEGNGTTIQTIEFYLDDITNPRGNFKNVCDGLTPGEDIKVSVAPGKVTENSVSVKFNEKTAIETNSLFGYLKTSDASDEHNKNKIAAVKPYYSDAGNTGLGLVLYNSNLYAQIDNARHLENLSPEISGYTYEIKGAIQTDNIYWSYESDPSLVTGPDSYTKIFTKELGSKISIYSQDGNIHNNAAGCFRPLNSNTKIELYSAWNANDNRNYKLSGIRVNEESGMAGIFAQTSGAITIQNLDVENGSFISKSDKAGGLIAYGENTVRFNSVNFTGDLTVKGQNIAGGFVAQSKESLNITKSSIKNASISSDTDKAGGLVGYTESDVTISETDITGTLIVKAKNIAGGFVAQPKGSLNITKSSIKNANISSDTDKAGGLAGYTESDVTISEMHITGDLTVVANNMAGGFVAQPKGSLNITTSSIKNASISSDTDKAGGLVGYTESDVTISKTDIKGKLTVQGKNQVGGFVGQLAGNATIQKSQILNATIISNEADAGGLIGYVQNSTLTIQEVSVEGLNAEVIAAKNAGGLIGCLQSCGSLNMQDINVTAFVTSDNTEDQGGAGGFFGVISGLGANSVIKNCQYYGADIKAQKNSLTQDLYTANINAKKSAGGVIGYAACDVELADLTPGNAIIASSEGYAGGLVGSSGSVTIKVNDKKNQSNEVNDSLNLSKISVVGYKAAGGVIGNAGNAAVIKNVSLKQGQITSSVSYAGGLIGNVEQYIPITIDQITLDQCEITGSQATGGFIGRGSNATVTIENSNVQNSSTIKSTQSVAGGLIGYTNQITNITNTSIAKTNITGYGCTGGFIGQYDQSNDLNRTVTIRNSNVRESTITSTNDKVGGFIGRADGSIKVDRGVVENTQITGTDNSAGGLAGITAGNTDLQNVKVIGKNTIIDGRNESGGLIGVCGTFGNVDILIKNAAVSAPIQSRGMHAGGFIGAMQATGYGYTKLVEISNSYYAGRTQNGSYVLKKAYDASKPDQISDYANIMGAISAGGFVGSTMDVNINFTHCFSTGSVLAGQGAGGIIGYARNIGTKITVNDCYSMGHVAGTISGGYIGEIDDSNKVTFNSAYYLNCFNDQDTNLIGQEPSNPNAANIINNPEKILGSANSSDMTTADHTHNYDETLNDQAYPYKNWTTDWETDGNPITYYGDWPKPILLNGKVVFYKALDLNNYKNGGSFSLTGAETSFNADLVKNGNVDFQSAGFGIISEIGDRDTVKLVYKWSFNPAGPFKFVDLEGASKYSTFNYYGKPYYFYRISTDPLEKLALEEISSDTFYIADASEKVLYKVRVKDGKAMFESYYN